jgi:predicted Co/Zn/Cd cation transporter (cation efflux family)
MRAETSALLLSAAAALLVGVVGVTAAVATGSGAILLDGLFNLAFFVTALFALRVARLLTRPDDERYPYGYLYFEPLINTVKGLLILGISLFALVDAAVALFTGGRAVVLGPALGYAAFATLACLLVVLALRRARRHAASPLVEADVANWTVNAAISGGVFAGFALALLLQRTGHATAAAHVDPALVALVILVSIGVPVRMAGRGLMALVNRAPPDAVVAGMEAEVRAALAGLPLRRLYIRAVQPGRTAYVTVHALLEPAAALDLATADRYRGAVIRALAARHAPVIVDVVFTAVEEYAAPTAGYVVGQPGLAGDQASGT